VSDPYEEPLNPEVLVNTEEEEIEESLGKVLTALESRGILPSGATSELAGAAT